MKAAWEQCLNGSRFTIAIVDDGVYERNPDIVDNYVSFDTAKYAVKNFTFSFDLMRSKFSIYFISESQKEFQCRGI